MGALGSAYLRVMETAGRARSRGPRIVIVDDGAGGPAVYFVDASGEPWRVHDCTVAPSGRRTAFVPPNAEATQRWFVAHDGVRRIYTFRRKDRRELEPRLLAAQLTAAQRSGGL